MQLSRGSSTQQANPRTSYRLDKSLDTTQEKTGAKGTKKLNTTRASEEKRRGGRDTSNIEAKLAKFEQTA